MPLIDHRQIPPTPAGGPEEVPFSRSRGVVVVDRPVSRGAGALESIAMSETEALFPLALQDEETIRSLPHTDVRTSVDGLDIAAAVEELE